MLLSPYSALGPMVLVSLKDKECPLFQLGLIFFTILLLHLRTKSVVKPRVVLLGKSRLFQTLQDLLTYEGCRLGLVHASVLFLLGCKGSRSSHCCSGYRGSSRGPYFKYAEVVTDQFADHCPSKAADSTWFLDWTQGTLSLLDVKGRWSSRSRSQNCPVWDDNFHCCTNLAGGRSCCYHKENIMQISWWQGFCLSKASELFFFSPQHKTCYF